MKKLRSIHYLSTLVLIVVSAGLYLLWRLYSPYPYTLNWDIWEHQTAINAIRSGSYAIFPSGLSDTFRFDGYTTLFHFIIAGIQSVFGVKNIPGFWWVAEWIFFTGTTLATYAFSFALTKNRWAALAGGILSAVLYESSIAFTTLFLLPQTLTALMWVFGMTILTYTPKYRLPVALLFSLLLIALHGIVGSLGAILLFIYAYAPRVNALAALGVGYLVPTLIAQYFPVSTLNSGEALDFAQTIGQKFTFFQSWYGFLPIPFLIMGIRESIRSDSQCAKILVVLFAGTTGLILSSFPYVVKFNVLTHYLMIALMALGMDWYMIQVRSTIVKVLCVLLLALSGGLVFTTNIYAWQKPVMFRGIASQVSADEIDAGSRLQDMYNDSTMLMISDPSTQYILEALSGINTQGGAYMIQSTRSAFFDLFASSDSNVFKSRLSEIHDLLELENSYTKLLVLSGRTFKWLESTPYDRNSIAYNIWRPEALSLQNNSTIESWKQQYNLQEIYRNPSVVVLMEGAQYDR